MIVECIWNISHMNEKSYIFTARDTERDIYAETFLRRPRKYSRRSRSRTGYRRRYGPNRGYEKGTKCVPVLKKGRW